MTLLVPTLQTSKKKNVFFLTTYITGQTPQKHNTKHRENDTINANTTILTGQHSPQKHNTEQRNLTLPYPRYPGDTQDNIILLPARTSTLICSSWQLGGNKNPSDARLRKESLRARCPRGWPQCHHLIIFVACVYLPRFEENRFGTSPPQGCVLSSTPGTDHLSPLDDLDLPGGADLFPTLYDLAHVAG